MTGLTAAVGAFIAEVDSTRIPERGRRSIVNAITDLAGVTLLGRYADVTRILLDQSSSRPAGEARIAFSERRAAAPDAALIGGASGHADDYDDIGLGFHPAHPSVPMAPAILAEAEALGASGRDVVTAYAVGYEVWGEIASRDETAQHVKGWHPTSVFGAVAAAAACARLRRLDARRAASAVAIAASQASGIVANFGTMTKPFHAGHAARCGVMSARYAAAGMTAGDRALEHDCGLLNAVSPAGNVDRVRPVQLGRRWWLEEAGIGLKLYPMCYATHRAIEGLLALIDLHHIEPDAIASMTVKASSVHMIPLVHLAPRIALDARFSIEFALAAAAIARRVSLAETTDAFVQRPDVQTMMRKVVRDFDAGPDAAVFAAEPDDSLTVVLSDGRVLERKLVAPRDRAADVKPTAIRSKFLDCAAASGHAESDVASLFEALQGIERLERIADLPIVPWEPALRRVDEAAE